MQKIYFGSEHIKFNILSGISLGYAFNGKYKQEYNIFGSVETDEGSIDFEDDEFNRMDFSLVFGLGTSFYLSNGYLFLDARYQLGLSDISTESPGSIEVFNRGIQFSLGYMFSLSK